MSLKWSKLQLHYFLSKITEINGLYCSEIKSRVTALFQLSPGLSKPQIIDCRHQNCQLLAHFDRDCEWQVCMWVLIGFWLFSFYHGKLHDNYTLSPRYIKKQCCKPICMGNHFYCCVCNQGYCTTFFWLLTFFQGVMVRLMLVLAPVACILSGISVSTVLTTYMKVKHLFFGSVYY